MSLKCFPGIWAWDSSLLCLLFPLSLFFSLLLLHVRPLLPPLLLSSAFSLSSLHPPQQTIMVENANLRAEIRKLRVENSDLLRRVRFADTNAHYMRVSAKSQVGPRMIKTPRWSQAPLSSPPVWSIHRRDKGYSVSSSIFCHEAGPSCSVKIPPWTCVANFQRCSCTEWLIKT